MKRYFPEFFEMFKKTCEACVNYIESKHVLPVNIMVMIQTCWLIEVESGRNICIVISNKINITLTLKISSNLKT